MYESEEELIAVGNYIKEMYEKADKLGYSSPNLKGYFENGETVVFNTVRFVGSDVVSGQTIFSKDGVVLKISPYERQYLNK